jgi:choline dehydrogenase-like flavoprotein
MPDFQVKKQTKQYDAVIVGSGAGGGMAAYMLSKAGLKVCLLEAGPMYDPAKNVTQLKNPWESVLISGLLVISMPVIGVGRLMENHIPKKKAPIGIGGGQGCWVAGQITGGVFRYDSALKILNAKVLTDWETTGRLDMKM